MRLRSRLFAGQSSDRNHPMFQSDRERNRDHDGTVSLQPLPRRPDGGPAFADAAAAPGADGDHTAAGAAPDAGSGKALNAGPGRPRPGIFGALRHGAALLAVNWNWKAALLSSLLRSGVFFGVNLTAGLRSAFGAMLTEFLYRAVMSGFYGTLTQRISRLEPVWRAVLAAVVLLPVAQHSLELLVHYLRGTPKLFASLVASVAFTCLSTLVNCYLMRNNVLIVGPQAKSLREDLASLPGLVRASWRRQASERGAA